MRYLPATFILLVVLPCCALGQTPPDFDGWFDAQVEELIKEASVDLNNNDSRRQRESPAVANGTSLVDQSAASDFITLALSTLREGVHTGAATGSTGSSTNGTVTVTGYSLLALASGKSLTDPDFYEKHTDARRLFLTVGTAASTEEEDHTDKDAFVVGVKYLIWNQRDLYAGGNLMRLQAVQNTLKATAHVTAVIKDGVRRLIFSFSNPGTNPDTNAATFATSFSAASFPTTFKKLTPAQLDQVRQFIQERLQPFQEIRTAIDSAVEGIRNRAQLAVGYNAKLRKNPGYQDHQFTLIYDHGLTDRISWTVNGAGDIKNRRTTENRKGAKLATEFLGQLTLPQSELWGRAATTLSLSGEAKWQDKSKPVYTVQAKLSIPIGTGIDLPVIYRYATRTANSGQSNPEAKLGLTIDTGRLMQLLR